MGRRWARRFSEHVGEGRLLRAIIRPDAAGFFSTLRGRPEATIDQAFRTVRTCFYTAIRQFEYITANPLSGLQVADVPEPEVRIMSAGEFAALIGACPNLWWRALLTVAYTCGLRLGELESLTWSDVDFSESLIRVSMKRETKKTLEWQPKIRASIRKVPVPDSTITLLDQLRWSEFCPGGHFYVFLPALRLAAIQAAKAAGTWHVDKRSQLLNDFHVRFRPIGVKAVETAPSLLDPDGRPDAGMHDLRRSLATRLSEHVAPKTLQAILGHSRIETTMAYYVDVTDEQLEKARRVAAPTMAVTGRNDSSGRAN